MHSRLSIMKHQYIYVTYHGTTQQTTYISANRISLVTHRHKTVKLSRRLLDTAAATLWNDLPDNIRNCDNTWIFKKLLKTFLTITCYLIAFTFYSAQTHNASIHCIVHHSVYTSIIPYLYFYFFIHKLYPIINIKRIQ